MRDILHSAEVQTLRQDILSQCVWSDTYSSLKHIIKRTANQLPLFITFLSTDDDSKSISNHIQTIFFFDRTVSNKILFAPLRQCRDAPNAFEVFPQHCTFAITDSYKGLFEFVRDGERRAKIFTNLNRLMRYATNFQSPVVFMSRDRALAYYQETNSSQWLTRDYPQGAIFRAERIHRSTVESDDGQQISNDYLECYDEDGYCILINLSQLGRYSLIATTNEQQQDKTQIELYLHSTQTPNIEQLIKSIQYSKDKRKKNICIRLVRGPVPNNFPSQYFQFVGRRTHDVLIGLTQEGLLVEYNIESHAPCQYAVNLNDILDSLYGTSSEQTFEWYVEQARTHYRERFQFDMQLISTKDWTAFFQYWKWTGSIRQKDKLDNQVTYQSRHRFHFIASIQDLEDYSRTLVSAYRKSRNRLRNSVSFKENENLDNKKSIPPKQRSILSQMSRLLSAPKPSKKHRNDRISSGAARQLAFALPAHQQPFDDSIYESNPIQQSPSKTTSPRRSKQETLII